MRHVVPACAQARSARGRCGPNDPEPNRLAVSHEKEIHERELRRSRFPSSRQYDGPVSRDALIVHLKEHALRTDGPFTLRSGATSDWYLDARQTTFDGHGARGGRDEPCSKSCLMKLMQSAA